MPDGLRLALTTYTVLPLHGGRVDRGTARTAMLLGPLVGLVLGLVAALVLSAAAAAAGTDHGQDATGLLPAALAVGTLAALTRGLHLDGLADLADGLGAHRPPEGALEVMRRGDVGPFGVVTVVLVLLVQVGALAGAPPQAATGALVLGAAVGRLAVTLACTPATPAARPGGLGALVAGTVPTGYARALAAAAVLLPATAAAAVHPADLKGPAAALAGGAVVAGLAAAALLRRRAVRRLGGVTGDVLGALVETATTAVLVVLGLALAA